MSQDIINTASFSSHPLTPEQIWGVPEDQLPDPGQKDYFEFRTREERILFNGEVEEEKAQTAEAGFEA